MLHFLTRCVGAAVLCALGTSVSATNSPRPVTDALTAWRLPANTPEPMIDGRLDDAVWREAPVYDRFVQFLPEDKRPAQWRTTVQVVLTRDALVFGIQAFDPNPALIRAPLARRDQVRRDQDFVGVLIDALGQRRTAQYARVNAAGVIGDGLFTAEDDVEDPAPDFDLQAAVQHLPDGYSVELRWPLASLRYAGAGALPWRVMVTRSIPRDSNVINVSSPKLDKDALSFIAEMPVLEGLDGLAEEVRGRSFLSLRPELTLRSVQRRDEAGVATRERRSLLGAEIKWRPNADWVIDATLNPDFSQVEIDAPQLSGNTRFALSLPEKRPFFLESAELVGQTLPDETGENRTLPAFYTRAITDPDAGLRASWRGEGAEATLLSLRDAGGGLVLRPGAFGTASHAQPRQSQASFGRARQQWGDLGVAALASLRDWRDGRRTDVLGSDFVWRASEASLWRGHLLASRTTLGFDAQGQPQRIDAQSGHRGWLGWRYKDADWIAHVNAEEVSPRFANDNGFVSQSGVRRGMAWLIRRLGAHEVAGLPIYESEAQLQVRQTRTLADPLLGVPAGLVVEQHVQPGFWFATARSTGVWGHLGIDRQRAHAQGRLHDTPHLAIGLESMPGETWNFLNVDLTVGRLLDIEADRVGRGVQAQTESKWRLPLPGGRWLEFEQRLALVMVANPQGQQALIDRSARSLVVLHLSPRDLIRLIAQQGRYQRRAEPGLAAAHSRDTQFTALLQHRIGLTRVVSIGWMQARLSPGLQRSHEVFVKAALLL